MASKVHTAALLESVEHGRRGRLTALQPYKLPSRLGQLSVYRLDFAYRAVEPIAMLRNRKQGRERRDAIVSCTPTGQACQVRFV